MEINLNFNLKDLDGKDIKDSNAGHIIANMLATSNEGDPIKLWEWAIALKENKSIQLDKSDAKTLRDFVENHKNLPVLTKAQVLNAIDNPITKGPKLVKK